MNKGSRTDPHDAKLNASVHSDRGIHDTSDQSPYSVKKIEPGCDVKVGNSSVGNKSASLNQDEECPRNCEVKGRKCELRRSFTFDLNNNLVFESSIRKS